MIPRVEHFARVDGQVFPAYAGMIPTTISTPPQLVVFPAYAGMIPAGREQYDALVGVPRIRGDDPPSQSSENLTFWYSPHTRG